MSAGLLLGVDLGSTASKAVLLDGGFRQLGSRMAPTGHDPKAVALKLRDELLAAAGREGAEFRALATGYGRGVVDYAAGTVTEITCHARGVRHLHPEARTVVDVGGQDCKVIRLDESGAVEDFAMNDRCAAGTGAFLDVVAARFGLGVDQLAGMSSRSPEPLEVSSTCVVFAETEVVGLISQGSKLEDVLAGVQRSIAKRIAALVARLGPVEPLYFSGGVALNETVRRELSAALATPVRRCEAPQFTAALGAALLAKG